MFFSLALFKVNWSKNFVVLTKGINSKNITNRKIDTFERCCTFDGPEMFSEKSDSSFLLPPLSSLLSPTSSSSSPFPSFLSPLSSFSYFSFFLFLSISLESVSGKISFSLTELSNSVTNHISSLTYGSMEIKTANFFFKQAEDATLFFLWASEVNCNKKERIRREGKKIYYFYWKKQFY